MDTEPRDSGVQPAQAEDDVSMELDEQEEEVDVGDDEEDSDESPEDGPSCGPGGECGDSEAFVYALGTIDFRFPSVAVEKEFAQVTQLQNTEGLTDVQLRYEVLGTNRYLLNELCWILTIEGVEVYVLVPGDTALREQLLEAIKPGANRHADCDVVIGTRGPMADPAMCNGLTVPMVRYDQVYSFDVPTLIGAIPAPEGMEEEAFRSASEELFYRIMQLADNVGSMDEHRAVNYLAMRYPMIYAKTAEMFANECSLSAVDVIQSRLSGARKLLDVVFVYLSRRTGVEEKFYVRVDVSEKWPFLASHLTPYYDR